MIISEDHYTQVSQLIKITSSNHSMVLVACKGITDACDLCAGWIQLLTDKFETSRIAKQVDG